VNGCWYGRLRFVPPIDPVEHTLSRARRTTIPRVASSLESVPANTSSVETGILFGVAAFALAVACYMSGRTAVDPDELAHLHAAWLWAQGVQPYSGFYCNHPPLYWLILRPVLGTVIGHDLASLVAHARLLSCLIAMGITAGAYGFFRAWLGRPAAAWGVALLASYFAISDRATQVRPDLAALLPLVIGSQLALGSLGLDAGPRPRPAWRALTAGVLMGLALLVSTKAGFWVAAILCGGALPAFFGADPEARRSAVRADALLLAGLLAPLAVFVAWLASAHALGAFWQDNFVDNALLAGSVFRDIRAIHGIAVELSMWSIAPAPLAMLGLASLLFAQEAGSRARGALGVMLLFAGAGLIALGNGPWGQYHIPLLVLIMGLAGAGIQLALAACPDRVRMGAGNLIVTWLVVSVVVLGVTRVAERGGAVGQSLAAYQTVLDASEPTDTYVGITHWNPVYLMDADPTCFLGMVVRGDLATAQRLARTISERRPRWVIGFNTKFWSAQGRMIRLPAASMPFVFRHYQAADADTVFMLRSP
jgi:hypothetical protein